MKNEQNERLSRALAWAKKRKLGTKQLNLFSRQYERELKASRKEKKLNKLEKEKKNKKKFNDICRNLRREELASS